MPIPSVKLTEGIHVMHLFFHIDRGAWADVPERESRETLAALEKIRAAYPGPAAPRVATYANVGGKADIAFILYAAELQQISSMQREIELAFPPGTLVPAFSYLSVTELPEYVPTEDDLKRMIQHGEKKLEPGTPEFDAAFAAAKQRNDEHKHYRLNPEMEDWEIMCFYPMSKKRELADNWYMLTFEDRKKLMAAHAKSGRRYAGKISQMITGSTGLDDWEWGVTLLAHNLDQVKNIIYEMRFDEVSARFGEFGPFYINLRLEPKDLWEHLKL